MRSTPPWGPPEDPLGEDTDSSSSSSSDPEPSPTPPSKGFYNAAVHTEDSSDGLSGLEEEEAIGNKGKRPAVGAKPSNSKVRVMYELCKEKNKLLKVCCAGYRREYGSCLYVKVALCIWMQVITCPYTCTYTYINCMRN